MAHHDNATRAQALTLKLILQLDNKQIEALTGLNPSTVASIADKALERGFDSHRRPPVILDIHVCDGPRSGRPSKQKDHKDEVLQTAISGIQRPLKRRRLQQRTSRS
ncbi:hypothetical protein N658DRAFT_478475 [Parathielavia hyrcaniae]|uniref:Uncharacterized protein n=1 Tax=Parathielavia hyrcaniae TaxID=113614 RepID=A0AAN6PTV1_9PEZI|nr:hypothetical protein N658DRAFT_478475 [Parathielavia hyrcaniae]